MNAIANLAATPCADLGECLADLAVDALIDEAELSPKPALVDRRGNGAHADLHLGLMQASALSLWPCFKEMADAAQRHGRIDARLRGVLGQLGRDGEAAMLRTTEGVNTHRGAIWALGLLVAAELQHPASLRTRHRGLGGMGNHHHVTLAEHWHPPVRRQSHRVQAQQGGVQRQRGEDDRVVAQQQRNHR
ncbi:triphosphoribosyl-dephospho-CoA synthase, partial [Pseudomonas aeruginosa]|uniref:triphosphoribosyl-dephospho-CoA synthase n=1 Tax=Pseudomonas aeruginosa TaxID=287 RepID=UPI00210065E7